MIAAHDRESYQPSSLQCVHCPLPNCNGERHKAGMQYCYPVCTMCGIELNELIDLYKEPALRSRFSCELCDKVYTSLGDVNNHFADHFRKDSIWSTKCIACNSMYQSLTSPKQVKSEELLLNDYLDPLAGLLPSAPDQPKPPTLEVAQIKSEVSQSNHLTSADAVIVVRTRRKNDAKPDFMRPRNVDGLYECQHCPDTKRKSFKRLPNILRHERLAHSLCSDDNNIFSCCTCSRRFKKLDQLQLHVRSHTKMEPDKCRVCEQTCENYFVKRKHETKMHFDRETKRWVCPTCAKTYSSLESLYRHVVQHDDKRPFICDQCGKAFRAKTHLATHMTTHSDDRPFVCDICPTPKNKSFATIDGLRLHIKCFHQRKASHSCDKCDRVFRYNTDLRRHRRSHGGIEKKHVCLVCDRRFYEPKELRVHMKQH